MNRLNQIGRLGKLSSYGPASRGWTTQLIPEYKTVYDALPTQPSKDIALLQNALLSSLVDGGVWARLDYFANIQGETEDSSRLDWKSLTRTLIDKTPANVQWHSLKGIKGNTAAYSHVRSQFRPYQHKVNIGQDDCTYGFFSNETVANGDKVGISAYYVNDDGQNATASSSTLLYSRFTSNRGAGQMHNTGDNYAITAANAVTDDIGCYMIMRRVANEQRLYKDTTLLATKVGLSSVIPNRDLSLFGGGILAPEVDSAGTSRSDYRIGFLWAGASLSDPQITCLVNAIHLYHDSVSLFFDE